MPIILMAWLFLFGAAVGSVACVARQSDDNAYIEDRRAAYEYWMIV